MATVGYAVILNPSKTWKWSFDNKPISSLTNSTNNKFIKFKYRILWILYNQPTKSFVAGLTKVCHSVRALCGVRLNPSLVGADVMQMLYRRGQGECERSQGFRTLCQNLESNIWNF